MKLTKSQAAWMEDVMIFSTLLISAHELEELVKGVSIEEIEDAYNKLMDALEDQQTKIREQLEIVEDDK